MKSKFKNEWVAKQNYFGSFLAKDIGYVNSVSKMA